jgi:hypothetical protein
MFLIKRWNDDRDWGDSHYIVCLVEKDPNLVIAHLQAKDMYRKLWRDRYLQHKEKWEKENLRPKEHLEFKKIPKWKAGTKQQDITPEMRQEREDIKAYNEDISKQMTANENVWANLLYTEMDRWMQEVGFPKELSENIACSYSYCTNYEYSFEEIELSELVDGQLVPVKVKG